MNTATLAGMAKKRGYSREFTPKIRTPESRRRITVDWIPPTVYEAVVAKAKREHVSMRALVIRLLNDWIGRGESK
jgi:hypothetical protein